MGDIKRAHEHFMENYGQQWNEIKNERDERERLEIERMKESERQMESVKREMEVQENQQQNKNESWSCCSMQ